MPYYLLRADVENYVPLGPKDPGLWNFFLDRFAQSGRFEEWEPFEVEAITEFVADPNALADMIEFNATPICLFSERAKTTLSPILERYGELLPVFKAKQVFYLYHVTTVLDALDEARSTVDRFSSGKIMRVKKYAFNEDIVGDNDVFRIANEKWQIFVSENFVNTVKISHLEGFVFQEI